MRLFIANIAYDTTEDELQDFLRREGEATRVQIIRDRETGNSRGFGFAEMGDREGARAIERLDGEALNGRKLRIQEAQAKPQGERKQYSRR